MVYANEVTHSKTPDIASAMERRFWIGADQARKTIPMVRGFQLGTMKKKNMSHLSEAQLLGGDGGGAWRLSLIM